MVAILYPRRLRNLLDVTQPQGTGLPDQGVPLLFSSNSSFVIQTVAGGTGGGSFSLGASNLGNTLGDTGVTGSRVVLAGIGNLTLSQATDANGGTISISGGTAGAGGVAISASNSLFSTGTVVLSGAGGGATVNTNGGTIQVSVATPVAQSVQTQNRFNLTLDGNTAGALAQVSSGTLTLAGGNGITLSQAGNAITISGNTFSQSVQPETQTFIGGISASDTLYTSGTVRFTGVGGGITVSTNTGQRIDLSVAAPVAQTGTQFSAGISGGNTSGNSGTVAGRVVFAGGNNITLSGSTSGASETITISAFSQTVQTQNMVAVTLSGNTSGAQALISSGTLTLAGGNNITVSQNGNAITISGPNVGGAQTGISGIIGSDATYTSGTVQFTGSNMITVKSSAGQRIVIDATQSVQPGIQNLVASDATFSSGTVSISGFGAATVNTAANLIRISVPVQSVQPETQTFVGGIAASDTTYTSGTIRFTGVGGGITVSSNTGQRVDLSVAAQSAESQSIGMSNLGNTSGTTGIASGAQVRMLFAGVGAVTLSQSLNGASGTLSISAPAQTVESQSIGMSNVGNTSGTTGVASGGQVRFVFAGGNNITLSQSLNGASGTITISAPNLGAGAMSAGVSNLGNTAGATGVTGTQLVFVGSDNITLSQTTGVNGGTVSIIGGAGGGFSAGVSTGGNTAGATGVSGTRMVLVGTNAISLSQTTGAAGNTVSIAAPATSSLVGTNGISVSSAGSTISVMQVTQSSFSPYDEAPLVTGQQGQGTIHLSPFRAPNLQFDRIALGIQVSNATNSSGSFTLSQWVGIYTQNASTLSLLSSTSISTNFSGSGTAGSYGSYGGPRNLTIPWTMTLTGSDYWMAINMRTTSGGADVSVSQLLASRFTNTGYSGIMGAASNRSVQMSLGLGVRSASSAGVPNSIGFADIDGTGSLALRSPVFQLRSGTV